MRIDKCGNKVYIYVNARTEVQIGLISHRICVWRYGRDGRRVYTIHKGRPTQVWMAIAQEKARRGNGPSKKS